MIARQLIPGGIGDPRVLAAMGKVPRHRFVEPALQDRAYSDHPLPIGEGQTISQPYMVAIMTEALRLTGTEKVLEIGTGSGYQAAVLAELAARVFTVERVDKLARRARQVLDELKYGNIIIKIGDGTLGWKEYAPYDRIIVTAGAPQLPSAYWDQLAEAGLIAIPTGDRVMQTLEIIEKREGREVRTSRDRCMFVPLIGKDGWADGGR
jgi:protein-L-isoaspartate(D-aspartate) O-methyltransferase